MTGNVADMAATGLTRTQEQEEEPAMKKRIRTCSGCSRTYQIRFYAECPMCEHRAGSS